MAKHNLKAIGALFHMSGWKNTSLPETFSQLDEIFNDAIYSFLNTSGEQFITPLPPYCIHPCCSNPRCSLVEMTLKTRNVPRRAQFPYLILQSYPKENLIISIASEDTNPKLQKHRKECPAYKNLPTSQWTDVKIFLVAFAHFIGSLYFRENPEEKCSLKAPENALWYEVFAASAGT